MRYPWVKVAAESVAAVRNHSRRGWRYPSRDATSRETSIATLATCCWAQSCAETSPRMSPGRKSLYVQRNDQSCPDLLPSTLHGPIHPPTKSADALEDAVAARTSSGH